jgi:peptidyl-Asp metalloendopeptidase
VHVTVNSGTGGTNVALAANGATAVASSTFGSGYGASGAINGDRKGVGWGAGGGWNDGTAGTWPDWLEVDFAGAKTINEVDVFSVQDAYTAPADPTATMTFSLYGLTDFTVQYWDGTQWLAVPGGAVSGNRLVWRQLTFAALTTTKIRVLVTGALNTWSRITEIEAYGTP